MGNSSSSSSRAHHDDSVDYGSLTPQGVYTGQRDWNQNIVSQLIIARRLAPFYRPLEDYEESWDDDQILAARKDIQDSEHSDNTTTRNDAASIAASHSSSTKSKRSNSLKEPARPEAQIYRGAVECPICFLYYPPNINHSRCCDQAICTECFVQIKRAEPTTTHVVSEPAACPYCVQDNFGIVYTPPPWRAGLGSDGFHGIWSDRSTPEPTNPPTHRRRQKSFGADSPEVVTTDHIRPDWETKLEAVRAAVARRANRRIIMRQVGDRLIPVGVTSGRVHALSPEEAAAAAAAVENAATSSGRRSRRRRPDQQGAFEQFIGMGGQDLEELMLMEAMRLSLLEHEEQQRKEAEEKKKQDASKAAEEGGPGESNSSHETSSSTAMPGPGPSTLEARSTSNLTSSSTSNLSVHGATTTSTPRSSSPSPLPQATNKSSSSSTQPTHVSSLSQDSLSTSTSGSSGTQARSSSWSLSRSRTPPPPPNPVTAAGVPMNEANDAAWRARGSSPGGSSSKSKSALGTLSSAAALTSTSVGAAVLGGSREGSRETSRVPTPEPTSKPEETVQPPPFNPEPAQDLAPAIPSVMTPGTAAIPMITVMNNEDTSTAPLTDELAAAMSEDSRVVEENPFLAPGEDADSSDKTNVTPPSTERSNNLESA
ncbi:hypothetical protein CVT24_009572 [Panaeolus cyanescens]|uniref:RING-type domain-containing protein n=1 Tax=Panaeolus cyanescens TaxID=181874 RepID=A0A409YAA3_9AGAR|nr:hypothetical protein CVT24_009572 [Panaeolus cyanescens]